MLAEATETPTASTIKNHIESCPNTGQFIIVGEMAEKIFKRWIQRKDNYNRALAICYKNCRKRGFLNVEDKEIEDILHEAIVKIMNAGIKRIYLDKENNILESKIRSLISLTVDSIVVDRFKSYKHREKKGSFAVRVTEIERQDPIIGQDFLSDKFMEEGEDYAMFSSFSQLKIPTEKIYIMVLQLKSVIKSNTLYRDFFKYKFVKCMSYQDISKNMKLPLDSVHGLEKSFILAMRGIEQ